MTTARERLAAIAARADAATPGPWAPFTLDDVDHFPAADIGDWAVGPTYDSLDGIGNASNESDATFIAHARTDVPALVAFATAVLDLHKPMRIYDECDHPHQEGDPGVIDTGEFLTCEEEYQYSICRVCCVENEAYPEQAEWCADKHDHRRDGHCPTVRLADEHLGQVTP